MVNLAVYVFTIFQFHSWGYTVPVTIGQLAGVVRLTPGVSRRCSNPPPRGKRAYRDANARSLRASPADRSHGRVGGPLRRRASEPTRAAQADQQAAG